MTTLAVLAGGQGSRMGMPKDRLTVGGRPVLIDIIERLKWDGPKLLIAAHGTRTPVGSDAFDAVVRDDEPGNGPLQGMLAALLASQPQEVTVFLPVDMPRVDRSHLDWLVEQLAARRSAMGVMIKARDEVEPFPCVLRSGAAERVRTRLALGKRSVQGLASEEGVEVVSAPAAWPHTVWDNLNSPEDLPAGWRRKGSDETVVKGRGS